MGKTCNCKHHPKKHDFKEEVIRVKKVYDWVNDSIKVKKEVFFGEEELREIEYALADPNRRPLRLVAKSPKTPPLFPMKHHSPNHEGDKFFCEQVGDKREVVVPVEGKFVEANEVDLLFNAEIEIEVIDRHGCVVTEACVDVAVIESFVLCYPDGTELLCRIQKILAEITSGTVFLNSHVPKSFMIEVVFCVDVQVEAEVKMEVLGKFASPRENNLAPIQEEKTHCPPVQFPEQCPAIYPTNEVCKCQGKGEASGHTTTSPHGTASVLVTINSDDLDDALFDLTFDAEHDNDAFTFKALEFDPDSLHCSAFDDGQRLVVRGSGETEQDRHLDFRLALVDAEGDDRFQAQFIDPKTGKEVFNTGNVKVKSGHIKITR